MPVPYGSMTCATRTQACSWLEVSTPRSSANAWVMRASRSPSTPIVTFYRGSKRTPSEISIPGWRVVRDRQVTRRQRRRGQLLLTLSTYHLLELAINVVQNGWTLEEAYECIALSDRSVMSSAECSTTDAQPSTLAMQTTRAMLEDIYQEVLRQNIEAVRLGRRERA